jgi:hypothetical protein
VQLLILPMNTAGNHRASLSATSSTSSQLPPVDTAESSNLVGNDMGLADVQKLVKALGIDASDEEIETMFRESDADGGGSIDESEFSELAKKLQEKAGRSIAGKIRWRKAIQFVARSLQNDNQKVR